MEELAINGGGPVREPLLGYGHQSISDDDVQAVVSTLKSDYLTCGPATERFEDAIREATGARYAAAVAVYCQALADKIGVMISTLSAFCVPTAFPTSEICQA